MRFKQIIENSTTAGSVATVAQPMMTQARESVNVPGLKPVQAMKDKSKKKGPYANSIVESKVNEDDLAEQDLIVIPGQGRLRRTGFVKHDLDQGEHEGHTLKNSLHTIARAATDLDKRLSVQSEFPEWVSEKIGAAKGMMVTVMDYLISSQEMQHDPEDMSEAAGPYDRRDAYQRDYDHSVAGMDRPNNHRDDERHDLDPTDWYKKVGTKMYTVSIYPRQVAQAEREGWHRTKEQARANAGSQGVAEGSLNESDKFTSWYDWKDQAKSSGYTITKKDDKIVALNKQGQVVGHWSDVGKFLSGKAPRPNFKRPVEQGVAEANDYFRRREREEGRIAGTIPAKKAVVKTNKPIGFKISDIGPGGKEHNVKTDAAWDAAKKKVSEGSMK